MLITDVIYSITRLQRFQGDLRGLVSCLARLLSHSSHHLRPAHGPQCAHCQNQTKEHSCFCSYLNTHNHFRLLTVTRCPCLCFHILALFLKDFNGGKNNSAFKSSVFYGLIVWTVCQLLGTLSARCIRK